MIYLIEVLKGRSEGMGHGTYLKRLSWKFKIAVCIFKKLPNCRQDKNGFLYLSQSKTNNNQKRRRKCYNEIEVEESFSPWRERQALKWFFSTSIWPEDKESPVNLGFSIQQNHVSSSKRILKHFPTKTKSFLPVDTHWGNLKYNIVQEEIKWYQRSGMERKESVK